MMNRLKKILTLSVAITASFFVNGQKIKTVADSPNKFNVKGTVTNAATGKPIRGIRLTYKEFAASLTDSAGNYSINLPAEEAVLLLSGDGYQSKEVAVKGLSVLNIVMYDESFSSMSDDVQLITGRRVKYYQAQWYTKHRCCNVTERHQFPVCHQPAINNCRWNYF